MDWNNVDLTDGYERGQTMLDGYDFDTLLMEIRCGLPVINEKTVTDHFNEVLNSRVETAKEIFQANLKNIVKQAKEEFKKLYKSDLKMENMNKRSVLTLFRLNLKHRFIPFHEFGLHIELF